MWRCCVSFDDVSILDILVFGGKDEMMGSEEGLGGGDG